jgi:hypothetical protein
LGGLSILPHFGGGWFGITTFFPGGWGNLSGFNLSIIMSMHSKYFLKGFVQYMLDLHGATQKHKKLQWAAGYIPTREPLLKEKAQYS